MPKGIPKITARMKLLLSYLSKDPFNISKACVGAGVDRTIHYRNMKNTQYATLYEDMKKSMIEQVESSAYVMAKDNPTMAMFLLKTKGGYVERKELDVTTREAPALPPISTIFDD